MLKIRDDVDLKELENFGFKIDKDKEWYCFDIDKRTNLFIKPISKEIILKAYSDNTRDINNIYVIYDLIKADLVEKVGD